MTIKLSIILSSTSQLLHFEIEFSVIETTSIDTRTAPPAPNHFPMMAQSGTLLSMEQTDANTTMSSDILVMFFIRFARIPSVHFTLTARTLKHEYLVAVLE